MSSQEANSEERLLIRWVSLEELEELLRLRADLRSVGEGYSFTIIARDLPEYAVLQARLGQLRSPHAQRRPRTKIPECFAWDVGGRKDVEHPAVFHQDPARVRTDVLVMSEVDGERDLVGRWVLANREFPIYGSVEFDVLDSPVFVHAP